MPRKVLLESEKAASPLSDMFFSHESMVEELKILAAKFHYHYPQEFKRAGLCAIRDAANVLMHLSGEADAKAGSDYLNELEARIRAEVAEAKGESAK